MAHQNHIIQSINLEGEQICVDIFRRKDGTYGFDEFRRDPEDGRGWYSIGYFADQVFETESDARLAADKSVQWLKVAIEKRRPDN